MREIERVLHLYLALTGWKKTKRAQGYFHPKYEYFIPAHDDISSKLMLVSQAEGISLADLYKQMDGL